jgi:hypothetical protein
MTATRRLAAIMAVDVVGYSHLMGGARLRGNVVTKRDVRFQSLGQGVGRRLRDGRAAE